MDIDLLTQFFMWCTIINGALLLLSFMCVVFGAASDAIYRLHTKWFPMSRETFNAALYLGIGIYKILVFVFNLVPWIVLTIIA